MTAGWALPFGVALCATLAACGAHPEGDQVVLPNAGPGIGFDDMGYSPSLGRVLIPAGRSGRLDLIDPESLHVRSIPGFSVVSDFSGGHDDGPTAVGEGRGYLFVTDRTAQTVSVVEPESGSIVASTSLAATPDYPRFVGATNELWITEPAAGQIEILSLAPTGVPDPTSSGTIAVDDGPESLVIDEARGRAYAHRWHAATLAFDLVARKPVAEWPNGCAASRGIALDAARGFLVAACSEGTLSVLDVAHGGALRSTLAKGAGFDVIGFAPALHHVYAAGSACDCLIVAKLGASGELDFVSRIDAAKGSSCATADEQRHAWYCDPEAGAVWRVDDPEPR